MRPIQGRPRARASAITALLAALAAAGCTDEQLMGPPNFFTCRGWEAPVEQVSCAVIGGSRLSDPVVRIRVDMQESISGYWTVSYEGLTPGKKVTPYSGSSTNRVYGGGNTRVHLGTWCANADSWYSPEPFTIELKEIEFGDSAGGVGGAPANTSLEPEPIVVSRVVMGVSCPGPLYALRDAGDSPRPRTEIRSGTCTRLDDLPGGHRDLTSRWGVAGAARA